MKPEALRRMAIEKDLAAGRELPLSPKLAGPDRDRHLQPSICGSFVGAVCETQREVAWF